MDRDTLADRVAALERAVTDGHVDDGLQDAAQTTARLDEMATTVDALDDRVAELEATVQALRGFAGGVRAVDEAIERRANDAVARVERLETDLRAVEAAIEREGGQRGTRQEPGDHADEERERHNLETDPRQESRPTDAGQATTDTDRFVNDADPETAPSTESTASDRLDTRGIDDGSGATAPTDEPETLPERVRAESDMTLAATAANAAGTETDQPTEADDSTPSLGERLRRLL